MLPYGMPKPQWVEGNTNSDTQINEYLRQKLDRSDDAIV